MPSRTVTISNKLGLHARPAMMLAECAGGFKSKVTIRREDGAILRSVTLPHVLKAVVLRSVRTARSSKHSKGIVATPRRA